MATGRTPASGAPVRRSVGPRRPHGLPYRSTSGRPPFAAIHPTRPHATMTPRPPAEDQRPAETTTATGDQWVIGHGHQRAVITEIGATLRSFTVEDRPVIDGFGPDPVEPGGTGAGPRPVAQPSRRRPLLLPGGGGPGAARRTGTPQRHPRLGPLAALADGGPGPEPGQHGLRAPTLPGLSVRPPADHRVPVGPGRAGRGDRGRESGRRRPALRAGLPSLSDRRDPDGGPGPTHRSGRTSSAHRRPRPAHRPASRSPTANSTSTGAGSSG